jgi:thioredoxin-dependent peroxiredoxin
MNVAVGQPAPDFTLPASDGTRWSLADQRGRAVVLYFYPKDATSGCTTQACDVRDHWAHFERAGATVVGVSPDDLESHQAFRATHDLPQTLLTDRDRSVIRAYGAWGTKLKDGEPVEGLIRSSVVISPAGEVVAVHSPVAPEDQSRLALEALAHAAT